MASTVRKDVSCCQSTGVRLKTVEMHAGGEPLRVVVSGYPSLKGKTVLDKMTTAKNEQDHLRKMLILEPRGHRSMYGAVLVPPVHPLAQLGAFFMHNNGYGTMCGHGVISLGRLAIEHGYVSPTEPETDINIECPCGLVRVMVEYKGGITGDARFESVVAFVAHTDFEVDVDGIGKVSVDISYGGSFFAIVRDSALGIEVTTSPINVVSDAAMKVYQSVTKAVSVQHPHSDELSFICGVIVTDGKDEYSKEPTSNISIFGADKVDRSPCGSGIISRLAVQYHKGQILEGQERVFQNARTRSQFTGKVLRESTVGTYKGVVVEVKGRAHFTGEATYTNSRETDDPLGEGFLIP